MPNEPDDKTGGADAPAFNQAQLDAINSTFSGLLGRHLPKVLGPAIESAMAPIREQFAPKVTEPKAEPDTNTRVSTLERELKAERDSRAKERRLAREERAFGDLKGALTGKVRPEMVEIAAENLFFAKKRVTVDDHGAITFKQGDETFDLAGGVEAYLRSDDAKHFLPAPSPAGRRQNGLPPRSAGPGGSQQQERLSPLEKSLRDIEAIKAEARRGG